MGRAAAETIRDVARAAEEAFVVAYPLVLAAGRLAEATAVAAPDAQTLQAPVNQLVHGVPGTADTRRISGWLDLGQEPLVLSTPETNGRYYVLWLRDAWNTAFASVGARTTGTGPHEFALLGPGRHGAHLLPGLTPIAAPTRIVRLAGCIEAAGADDGRGHERLQAGFRLAPLSRWRPAGAGSTALRVAAARYAPSAVEQLEDMDAEEFFAEVRRLVGDNPPEPADRPALDFVSGLGAWEAMAPEVRSALQEGVRRGRAAVRAEAERAPGETIGTWRMCFEAGRYGSDCLQRAAAARSRRGTYPAVDELPAFVDADADGRPFTGRSCYVLRFPPRRWPPVNGFWSLSTCVPPGGRGRDLHSIGDLYGLTLDADGALPIYIQHSAPPRGQLLNWLPAPPDRFSVALRLYWPCEEVLQRRWSPPAVARLDHPRDPGDRRDARAAGQP